jgi:hypothetical protein
MMLLFGETTSKTVFNSDESILEAVAASVCSEAAILEAVGAKLRIIMLLIEVIVPVVASVVVVVVVVPSIVDSIVIVNALKQRRYNTSQVSPLSPSG